MPVYTQGGAAIATPKVVTGRVIASSEATSLTIALTGSAVFSSNTSYNCTANVIATKVESDYYPVIAYTSGSSFTLRFKATIKKDDRVSFICVGN
jgi:hypothetical protein